VSKNILKADDIQVLFYLLLILFCRKNWLFSKKSHWDCNIEKVSI